MSTSGILHTVPEYHRNLPCLLSAEFSGVKLTTKDDKPATTCTSSTCLSALCSKMPKYVWSSDGSGSEVSICDPSAIAYHVASDKLKGLPDKQSQVLQWVILAERDILPIVEILAFSPCRSEPSQTSSCEDRFSYHMLSKAKIEVVPLLTDLDNYLKSKTFFVGERITLADITMFSSMFVLFKLKCAEKMVASHKHLLRWFRTVLNQPEVFNALHVPYTMFAIDAPLYPGVAKAMADPKKGSDVVTTASEKNMSDEVNLCEPAEKPKNPLAALPKGTFSLDEFKRTYCNQDTDSVAIPYMWDHFDSQHYSFWFSQYQYSDELKMKFMTSNLVSGMFQRLDSLRNHAFASVCIFGEDFKNTISGVWIWRGQELAFPLCPDWTVDYESYKWEKLDVTKPEVREMIDGYMRWKPAPVNGLEFADGKIFK